MSDPMIRVADLHKWFGKLHVLRGVSCSVSAGEVVVLCGPSGSGKSTLLRCINLLEQPTSGEIRVDGLEVTGSGQQRVVNLRSSAARGLSRSSSVRPPPSHTPRT